MKKLLGQSGMTMVEMMVTFALMSILGGIVYSVVQYADRQTKIQTEDIQNLIMKYGGSKILQTDIARANPSFNFLHLADASNKPFFVLAQSDLCQHPDCSRTFKLEIPPGNNKSQPFFFLIVNGIGKEMTRFTIEPDSTFVSGTYQGINPKWANPALTISKSNLEHSPWTKSRLMMLSSANMFYDCNSLTGSMLSGSSNCKITCKSATNCNYATTRATKFLGVVKLNESDMLNHTSVISRPTLFNNTYKLCRPTAGFNCPSSINYTATTTKNLIEKMPYLPGSDNLTFITPVQLVRYHLEKPTPSSPDHKIFLMRSVATITGSGQLSFDSGHVLMTGIQSLVFSRNNISNPTIEYKLNKVRTQTSIK